MAASEPRCQQPESMSDVGERRGTPNDGLYASNQELSQWIEVEMCPFARQIEGLVTIPGVRRSTAEVIIAATGSDKPVPRRGHLPSWAGVCSRRP